MSNNLPILKNCSKCDALIEAREKICEYCKHVFEIPRLTPEEHAIPYTQICEDINNAFFRFEGFMYGNALNYQSFNFDRAFSVLFIKTREAVNYNPKNFKLIGKYWELTQQITYDHDKTNYTNYSIDDNEDFINDLNAIYHLYDRVHEFNEFTLPEDWEEKRLSILDIQKDFFESKHIEQEVQPKQILKKSKKKSKKKGVKNEFSKLINEIEIVFKYNYPALEKPLQFYYNAKECIRKFKYVTPIKFKSFSKRETILALKHFDFVINELLAHAQTDFKTIEKWLLKYSLQHYEVFQTNKRNELIEFLNQNLPSLKFSLSDDYNKDQEHIQYDFFNYWYGFFLMEASTFIQELNYSLNPNELELGYNSSGINTETLAPQKLDIPFYFPKLSDYTNPQKKSLKPTDEIILRDSPRIKNSADNLEKQIINTPSHQFDIISSKLKIKPSQQFEIIDKSDRDLNKSMDISSASEKRLLRFKDIFLVDNYDILIAVLGKIEPPLIDEDLNYIGPKRGKKGLLCSWILTLQKKGKIRLSANRQILSEVLNNEIKYLNLGKDGSTFSKYNKDYEMRWKNELLKLAGLLP